MANLTKKPWFWPVAVLVMLIIVTKGAVLGALAPMSKFLIPALGIYGFYRLVKWKLKTALISGMQKAAGEFTRQQEEAFRNVSGSSQHAGPGGGAFDIRQNNSPIIEICPQCGREKTSRCPDKCHS